MYSTSLTNSDCQAYTSHQTHLTQRSPTNIPKSRVVIEASPAPSATLSLDRTPKQALTTSILAAPAAQTAFSRRAAPLSIAAIAGLCTAIGIVVLLALYSLLEICVLRKRGGYRASRRTVDDIEQGSNMNASVIVMEGKSQVLIEEEELWAEDPDGSKGMSLPRRVW